MRGRVAVLRTLWRSHLHPRLQLIALPVLLSAGHPGASAADCSASGNTYWSFTPAATVTYATIGPDGIWVAAGSELSLHAPATGATLISRVFLGVTLRRPVTFELRFPIGSPSTTHGLVLTGDNGYVYDLNPTHLGTIWSRTLQRTGRPFDTTSRAPAVVQLWANSDATYQAARDHSTVIVGTDYSASGGTTDSRVYGLDASTGNMYWLFNPTGALQMDAVHGLAVDYARNSVYVVSDKQVTSPQNTVWSINTVNGFKRWGVDLGAVDVPPVLAAGRLFVATRAGDLYELDPATGATLWQITVTTLSAPTHLAVNAANGQIQVYVVAAGSLYAYAVGCGGFSPLWTFGGGGFSFTDPAFLGGFLYVGANDGRTWQVRASDGVANAHATISGIGATPSYDPIVFYEGLATRLLASSGGSVKKLCVPWPDTPGDKAFLFDLPNYMRRPPPLLLGADDPAEPPGATPAFVPRDTGTERR